MGDNYQEALEIMCHRCVNHEACQGTGCTPKKDIKKLVDKATPKKPFYEADGYDENGELIYDTWICPNCNHYYEVDYDDYDYCPNCGQRLDWSDKDGK